MTDLFLSPHNDDETLFGAFTLLAHRPHVVVCFKSQVQQDRHGILAETRESETEQALWTLGCDSWQQSPILDNDPDPAAKLIKLFKELNGTHRPSRVWAPAIEAGGHDQHNAVGQCALDVFGVRVRPYLTYVRGAECLRTRGTEIPFQPSWPILKMRALCCYASQIALDNTRAWFIDDTLREYRP